MSTKLDEILQRLTLLEIHYQFSNVLQPSLTPSSEQTAAGAVPQLNTKDGAAEFEPSFVCLDKKVQSLMEESLNSVSNQGRVVENQTMEAEVHGEDGSKFALGSNEKSVFGRGCRFGNYDCTVSRHHVPFELDHSDSEDANAVSFEVLKETPFWVYDREALGLFKKFNKGLGHFLGIDTFDPGGYLKGLKRRKEIIDYQYAWGYIMGNERLDANYVVPQWMPQFMCKSEARTLIVLDEVWTLSVVDQLMCRIPGCKFLVVSRPKFQMVLSYEVELLIEEDALSLFCHHAFGLKSIPLAANENLVKRVVTECGRLPLALKVEKIFGTGNQHVTAAKMILQNIEAMVSIGMPASPSEVLVIADKHVVPRHVAADLHSQVEHGPDSQVVPVISGEGVDLNAIEEELSKQCQRLPRGEFAAKALSHSFIVYAHDMLESIKFSNLYAPEHLIVNAKDADKLEDLKLKYNLEDKVALEAHGNVMNKNRKQQDTEQEPEKEERPRREINKPHYLRDFV
ncbi:hypothetical protein GYH30_036833 [Glycine max]|uniref:uncharacterized protein n=2 Tax=Glycine subgen. Soja TaxID=1462606 RepID=UPI0007191845|nr:uncharacterized protein LOC106795503 [Glycine max]XP_025980848.1 uncharacterized protein LOC106795503 [Glycine max]KAH1102483.1 hypothetical protein GYH30_036833 [Glycine max]|eukprot:XP_025980847.1 uncharacterized protein LOC106795503 [Glycine max]